MRCAVFVLCLVAGTPAFAQHTDAAHDTPDMPGMQHHLGTVAFANSCSPAAQSDLLRGVAMLHSFWYSAGEQAFRDALLKDPRCAIADWGIAALMMNNPLGGIGATPSAATKAQAELDQAHSIEAPTQRERDYVDAVGSYYKDFAIHTERERQIARGAAYEALAAKYPDDDEAQIFGALYIAATQAQSDQTYSAYGRAAAILEPMFRKYPNHPGVAHYLIHAYDKPQLAQLGLPAARRYAQVAPAAPHALHMPSHIFTRLGLWDDSIASNQAARAAAHGQGDQGEELHAMDYLTYAYLQRGRNSDAERVVASLSAMTSVAASGSDFKVGYAATAMPVRLAIERHAWHDAAELQAIPGSAPHVAAIIFWARATANARSGRPEAADTDIAQIERCKEQLQAAGNTYWATQVDVLAKEAKAWRLAAAANTAESAQLLRQAADEEDAVEKLPVTPGPIVPAREQLGEMLLQQNQPAQALQEFRAALVLAPGRRGALLGGAQAAERAGDARTAAQMRAAM